jgi:hypothetical protein
MQQNISQWHEKAQLTEDEKELYNEFAAILDDVKDTVGAQDETQEKKEEVGNVVGDEEVLDVDEIFEGVKHEIEKQRTLLKENDTLI